VLALQTRHEFQKDVRQSLQGNSGACHGGRGNWRCKGWWRNGGCYFTRPEPAARVPA
jgi:hypothetical protein